MECSIVALVACFSWSNLYIDGHVTALDKALPHYEWRVTQTNNAGVIETVGQYALTDRADNPYGGVALGLDLPF